MGRKRLEPRSAMHTRTNGQLLPESEALIPWGLELPTKARRAFKRAIVQRMQRRRHGERVNNRSSSGHGAGQTDTWRDVTRSLPVDELAGITQRAPRGRKSKLHQRLARESHWRRQRPCQLHHTYPSAKEFGGARLPYRRPVSTPNLTLGRGWALPLTATSAAGPRSFRLLIDLTASLTPPTTAPSVGGRRCVRPGLAIGLT